MYGMSRLKKQKMKTFNQLTRMKIRALFLLFFVMVVTRLHAQEVLLPLQYNPEKSEETLSMHRAAVKNLTSPLTLPFWDDFSYKGPYPDNARWADNYVFINSGSAVHPKTYHVATFDILDDEGRIYEHAAPDNQPFPADHLTSHPIDLGELSPADSVVLSFYYQPQGRGGDPSTRDSLLVQFYLPADGDRNDNEQEGDDEAFRWQSVWGVPGESLKNFSQDTFPYFKRGVIPITDDIYFREDFRFRFRNHASFAPEQTIPNYSATANIWNIDYVYLDRDRSVHDTAYYDVAFAAPAQSLLQEYTAMPWSHYIADPLSVLRESFDVRITNLDVSSYNYTYRYIIQDEGGNILRTYSGGSWVIAPFSEEGYQEYQPHANPVVLANPLPAAPATSRHFRIVHSLREGATGDAFPENDTIVYDQVFSNYFSHDDGSPEMVHLTKGYNPGRAMKFIANHPDTVEAVQLYFMETINNQDQQQAFELKIWDSLDPEEILYRSTEPLFSPENGRSGFVTLELDDHVLVEDTFYVGIIQPGNVPLHNSLVIGYDLDNDASHRLFNNFGDGEGWQSSIESGALMIRPVMKRDDITGLSPLPEEAIALTVYPNPAGGQELNIRLDETFRHIDQIQIRVYDTAGRLLHTGAFTPALNISGLNNGMYLLQVMDTRTGRTHTTRFIISR